MPPTARRVSLAVRCLLVGLVSSSLPAAATAQTAGRFTESDAASPASGGVPVNEAADPAVEAPAGAVAQDVPPPQPVSPQASALARLLGPTTVYATADTYYEYNGNRPQSGTNALRNFDEKDNQFSLSYLEFAFEQVPTETRRLGFRADLGFGPTATWVGSADPDEGRLKYLQQGYVSYLAPVGRGVQIDVGKFVTPAGAELIESAPNWNYSRSLLFAWAGPYYHVGVRAVVPLTDKVTATGFLLNGWNNATENNRAKTLGAQVAVTPFEGLSISQTWLGGSEQSDGLPGWRHLFDTVVTWDVHPRVSLMGNVDIGRDEVLGERMAWHGVAGYARIMVLPTWHLTPRLEWFEDAQGFATGTGQSLREITLTSEHTLVGGLSARIEYRRDWSNAAVFAYRADEFRRTQHTVLVGLIYAMQTR